MVYKSNEIEIIQRFKEILEKYEIDATTLSKRIDVEPSSISHILSGRNKPSFKFLRKLAEAFPELNINWLLTGKGEMIIDKDVNYVKQKDETTQNQLGGLFNPTNKIEIESNNNDFNNNNQQTSTSSTQDSKQNEIIKPNIKKIIILYSDGTFEYYDPKE